MTFRRAWLDGATSSELTDLATECRRGLPSPAPPTPAALFIHSDILITAGQKAFSPQPITALWMLESAHPTVNGQARLADDLWRDTHGTPIPVNAHIEQTGIDPAPAPPAHPRRSRSASAMSWHRRHQVKQLFLISQHPEITDHLTAISDHQCLRQPPVCPL